MSADNNSDQIPAIRTFQLDSSALGDLESSVNLFRGDINLTQTLFTMPGRTPDQGLAVSVSLLYQSNVNRDAMTWNRDAPTGVVGLGWSLPTTYIELDDCGSPTPGLWRYNYWSNGTQNQLVPEPAPPHLFAMPASLAGSLSNNQPLPAAIAAEFANRGVAISAGATVVADPANATLWTVRDDVHQQLFTLVAGPQALDAYDGGQSFQLFNFQFWKILYYPNYERWAVTTESGQTMSFGGLGAPQPSRGTTAVGNSIEWAVRWTDASGAPLWIGPSTALAGQQQYARAWRLAGVSNIWGDAIAYAYNEFRPDPRSGLIPGVEQPVGASGGKIYTKACYLTSITDVFGRKATLSYGDKLWSDATPQSPREYADPHKTVPDDTPNAYQDRYETKYLCGIAVADADGAPLFSVGLAYEPSPAAQGADRAVANVTGYTGALKGDTFKRYLTGISLRNADGNALPNLDFAYCLNPAAAGGSPGALASVTYPQGGVADYTYEKQLLPICNRQETVTPPSSNGWTPRVWFGPDYAVTTWYEAAKGQLALQIFTWLGRWEPWQLDPDNPLLFDDKAGLNLSSLDVVASQDYVAVHFQTASGVQAYVLRKSTAQPGQWVPATVDGVITGRNRPTLSYAGQGVSFAAGNAFLIASQMRAASGKYAYDRLTWRWTTRSWSKESFKPTEYTYITASGEYYVALGATSLAVGVTYLDSALAWRTGGTGLLPGGQVTDVNSIAMVPGASMVAISRLLVDNLQTVNYNVSLFQWDGGYAIQAPANFGFQDRQEPSGRYSTSWTPVIVNNSLVAVAGHVLRFNGQSWLANSSLSLANPPSGAEQRYAYGPDYVLQIVVDGNGVAAPAARVLGFDPNTDCSSWTTAAATPSQQLPVSTIDTKTSNWPSSGQDSYLTLGQYLYFRGTSTDWQAVVETAPEADLQALVNQALGGSSNQYILNAQSVVDEAPTFLTYYVYDSKSPSHNQTAVVLLKNGEVSGAPAVFSNQHLCVAADPGGIGPGRYPGGPASFFTYPDTAGSFDAATEYSIYRYTSDAVSGPLLHYAVVRLALSDGFQDPYATAYRPDPAYAACDPTGTVVKYYKSTVYPGSSDPGNPQYGAVVNTYLNGLEVATGDNYYDMLDGLLIDVQTQDNDGITITETTNEWTVYTQRAAGPAAGAAIANLNGAFVCQTSQTKILDGVRSTRTTSFYPEGLSAPYSGQPVRMVSATLGGAGTSETFVTEMLYGYDIDEVFPVLNILTTQVQSVTTWTPASGAAVTTQAQATTYTSWPSAAGAGVMVPAAEADFAWFGGVSGEFPFGSYQPGQVPPGWMTAGRVLRRTPQGLVDEAVDGCGVVQSTLYGAKALPVAQVVNASLIGGEWTYCGFEDYETSPGVAIRGATPVAGDAHTGDASLGLPGGGSASVEITVTPANVAQTYVLGYWYKTPAGFAPTGYAGWTIVVSVDGYPLAPQWVGFGDTGGAWAYNTVGVPLTPGSRSLSLTATATNGSAATVLLDDVFAVPLGASLSAKTFDAGYNLVTSTMDAGGHTLRTQYDRFQRVVASIGPDEAPKEVAQRFLSRQGDAASAFNPASPNADLTLHPAGGGSFETFLSGNEWSTRWTAANPGDWRTGIGYLDHTAARDDTLAWAGRKGTTPPTAALFFEVVPQAALAGQVGVTFAGGYRIYYDAATGYGFTAPGGAVVQAPLAAPPAIAEQWLLVLGHGVVLFFGDGQLLFSADLDYGEAETVALTTGPNLLRLRNLAMLAEPRLGLSYSDAAGRQRQTQQLHGDPATQSSDARLSEVIYDALDRKVAVTKIAPARFGTDAGLPLLRYHPNFANVEAFLADMANSWVLTGDVADYYRGQSDGPVSRSDDQGYPYRGYRYMAAALDRQVERGLPGKQLSIHDVNNSTPADRQTTQFLYAANGGTDPSLPAGSYNQRIIVGPLKSQGTSLQDTAGRQVFSLLAGPGGGTPSQTAASVTYAGASPTASGGTMAMQLPNYFTDAPQSGQADFVSYILQDSLGRIASRRDPSSNTTLYIYDPVGRLRFLQPALSPGEQRYIYYKYDPLGRLLEEGTIEGVWDAVALQAHAADLAWPSSAVLHTVARAYSYDGNGNDPTLIGQKIRTVTANPAPAANGAAGDITIAESFAYDSSGRITSVAMALSGAVSESGTIGYAYNNLNEVTLLTYPAGAPLDRATYRYDDQGRVTAIGSAEAGPDDIAAYTYTADGEIETEVRNAGKLIGTRQYTSPGWLQQQTETIAGAASPCFAIDNEYNADATLKQRAMTFAFGGTADATTVAYTYDGQRRLTDAAVADGKLGNEAITSYDANGNIWQATQDGSTYDFACASGSDCLAEADLAGYRTSFAYSPDGWLTAGNGLAVEHDLCLGLATNVAVSGGTATAVRFGYGGHSQRVLKQASGGAQSSSIAFCGSSQYPVAVLRDGQWESAVMGPSGLVAVAAGVGRYFPLRDYQQTVWGAIDDTGELAARYNFLPFGGLLAATGPAVELLGCRFMGQALDRETGLYDFRARLYDPRLRRFCSPDTAHQFTSPYLFAGNDPLSMTDPSGELSVWARVGIGAAMVALAIAGITLSIVTAGAAAPEAAAGEAALGGALAGGEAAAAAGGEAAAAGAVEGAAAAGGEAAAGAVEGAAAGGEVAAGVAAEAEGAGAAAGAAGAGAAEATSASSSLASNLNYLAIQGASGGLTGAGTSGLQYDIQHGRDFTAAGFFEAMGIGAASGVVSGVLGGLPGMPAAQGLGSAARIGATLAAKGLAGGISSDVSQLLTNAAQHQPWSQGLASAFGIGFAKGLATGAVGLGASRLMQVPRVGALVDRVTAAAKSDDAKMIYMTAGFFLISSYVVWGVAENSRHSS